MNQFHTQTPHSLWSGGRRLGRSGLLLQWGILSEMVFVVMRDRVSGVLGSTEKKTSQKERNILCFTALQYFTSFVVLYRINSLGNAQGTSK